VNVSGITGLRRLRARRLRARGRMLRQMTPVTGWLGHKDIPRPALVRQESLRAQVDGLDCLLAIWIAEAMLDGRRGDGREEAS